MPTKQSQRMMVGVHRDHDKNRGVDQSEWKAYWADLEAKDASAAGITLGSWLRLVLRAWVVFVSAIIHDCAVCRLRERRSRPCLGSKENLDAFLLSHGSEAIRE